MPRGRSLYGALPAQLRTIQPRSPAPGDPRPPSEPRHRDGSQVDIPEVAHAGMLVLVHRLDEPGQLQLTVLNFADEPIEGTVRSEQLLPPGG